ncbi:BTAD domain-containing putative transcriptional regulator [Catenulispora rubra]|uniref:BTAD domain-containing putative transcriptional regulator n=1 Tax=Catenulispora rubra TaxID=280293 RepID=UPI0018926A49|nr:BTAD domain-containing putative transcriptional regulator [Catenulispora rubra]
MWVGILGPLEVVVDGEQVPMGGARLRALMIRLALDAGRPVTVGSLSAALWPEGGPQEEAHALHSLASRLRQALGRHPALRSSSGAYSLDLTTEAVDALHFTQLAQEGRRALAQGRASVARQRLDEALGLWRGEALADVAGAPFAQAVAARLEEVRLGAVEDKFEALLAGSALPAHAVAELEELVAAHPLRERLRTLLVQVLDADGRQSEALAAFEQYRRLLAEELGTDPGQRLQRVYMEVLRGTSDPAAAERPPAVRMRTPGNFRVPLSSFVGRTEDIAAVADRLKRSRLVTLVGPGGVGKTRLAGELVAGYEGCVPGGVWVVELASATEPEDVTRLVADALGLREPNLAERDRDAVLDRLVEFFSGSLTVLLLDNCEHLLDTVARCVDELLGRCPLLKVMTTSREPLGVPGEAQCPVLPLGWPEPGATVEQARESPAIRLLLDRASEVRPDFELGADNVAALVEVCRRLDGLPLAIELAAARLRSLPLEQLVSRLDDRFRLLTGGSRTALPRHQTLRAVVAWSWSLLREDERRLAERLAVFPREVTLAAAEGVCAQDGTSPETVLDVLAALVDKSLLQVVDGPEGRYRMLETIREYALERLLESGRLEQARRCHVAHFLGLAEQAAPALRGDGQLPWLARLACHREDLLCALQYAIDVEDADTAVRLAAALGLLWTIHGDHAGAATRLLLALRVPGGAGTPARAAAASLCLINTVLAGGMTRASLPLPEYRVLALTRHGAGQPAADLLEPCLALVADDVEWGMAAIGRRLPHPDPWAQAMLLLVRAFLQGNHGDMRGTRVTLEAAVEAFGAAGERWGSAMSLTALAEACSILGEPDRVVVALEESIRLLRELDPDDAAVLQRSALALARTQEGDVAGARVELEAIVGARPGKASPRHLMFARIALGNLGRYEGDLVEAEKQYAAAAEDLGRVANVGPLFHATLGAARGHWAVAVGDFGEAARLLGEALTLAVNVPDMPVVAMVAVGVAGLRAALGRPRSAAEVLGAAHSLRGAGDDRNPDVARLAEELIKRLRIAEYAAAYAAGHARDRAAALAFIEAELASCPGLSRAD